MRVKSPEGRAGGAEPGAWETRGQLHFGVVPSTLGPCHSCLVLSLTGRVLLSVAVRKAGAEPTPSLRPSPGGLHRRPGWGGPPCRGSGPSLGGLQSSRDSARGWHNWPHVARDLGPHARGAGPPTALAPDPRPSPFSVSPDLRLHPFQGLTPQMRVSRPESRTWGTRFGPHQGGRQRFSCSVPRGWAGFVRANTHLGI